MPTVSVGQTWQIKNYDGVLREYVVTHVHATPFLGCRHALVRSVRNPSAKSRNIPLKRFDDPNEARLVAEAREDGAPARKPERVWPDSPPRKPPSTRKRLDESRRGVLRRLVAERGVTRTARDLASSKDTVTDMIDGYVQHHAHVVERVAQAIDKIGASA